VAIEKGSPTAPGSREFSVCDNQREWEKYRDYQQKKCTTITSATRGDALGADVHGSLSLERGLRGRHKSLGHISIRIEWGARLSRTRKAVVRQLPNNRRGLPVCGLNMLLK